MTFTAKGVLKVVLVGVILCCVGNLCLHALLPSLEKQIFNLKGQNLRGKIKGKGLNKTWYMFVLNTHAILC